MPEDIGKNPPMSVREALQAIDKANSIEKRDAIKRAKDAENTVYQQYFEGKITPNDMAYETAMIWLLAEIETQ